MYLSSRSHGTSLTLLQNLCIFAFLRCSVHIRIQIVLPEYYGSFNIQVYIKLSVRGSRGREECPSKYRGDDDICRSRARTPPAADTGGGVTDDRAVRNILWKTKFGEGAFSLLNFWFYHTLLATDIQPGLFRCKTPRLMLVVGYVGIEVTWF